MRPKPDALSTPLPFLRVLSEVSATLRAASNRVGRSASGPSNSESARAQASEELRDDGGGDDTPV